MANGAGKSKAEAQTIPSAKSQTISGPITSALYLKFIMPSTRSSTIRTQVTQKNYVYHMKWAIFFLSILLSQWFNFFVNLASRSFEHEVTM